MTPIYPMQKEREVQILYFNSDCREFRFQSEDLPSPEQVDELWEQLPDWVVEGLTPQITYMYREEKALCDRIFYLMNHYEHNPLAIISTKMKTPKDRIGLKRTISITLQCP